jgi:hypothetical protein
MLLVAARNAVCIYARKTIATHTCSFNSLLIAQQEWIGILHPQFACPRPPPMTKAEDIPAMLWQAHQGYFELLGRPADLACARTKWKILCLLWHPDKTGMRKDWNEQAKQDGLLLFQAISHAMARRRDAHAISCGPSAHAWIIFRGPCATAISEKLCKLGQQVQCRPSWRHRRSQECGVSLD